MAGTLTIVDPDPHWHGSAYVGHWEEREALILLGAEGSSRGLEEARALAADVLDLELPNLLPLRAVDQADGRLAWVYDRVEGLSLHHTLESEETLLSPKAAAEVVARVGALQQALLSRGLRHPGPDPSDILLGVDGRLWVSGVVGPFPPSPAFRPPGGETGETAVVWRLGVLLAQLVTGVAPAPPSEEGAHDALVRRVLIRAMSRPGAVLGDRYGDWLRGMLSWSASARPPLSSAPNALSALAEATGGPTFVDWSETRIPELWEQAERQDPRRRTESAVNWSVEPLMQPFSDASVSTDEGDTPTAPNVRVAKPGSGPADLTLEDDPTIESLNVDPAHRSKPPPLGRGVQPDPNRMPVSVGPPPEAVSTRPKLPSGFLDKEPIDEDGVARVPRGAVAITGALAAVLSIVLAVIAVFLLVYILWPVS